MKDHNRVLEELASFKDSIKNQMESIKIEIDNFTEK
jgi:hypothetical protein